MYIPDPYIKTPKVYTAQLEEGISVNFGPPLKQRLIFPAEMEIPYQPHVFLVDELYLTDAEGAEHRIEDMLVLLGHGGRRQGKWVFQSGQSIPDTVAAVNAHLSVLHNRPWIDAVIACNKPGEELVDKIDVHYFDEYPYKDTSLLYALDATLSTYKDRNVMRVDDKGGYHTRMEVLDENGAIKNIETFMLTREMKVDDGSIIIQKDREAP